MRGHAGSEPVKCGGPIQTFIFLPILLIAIPFILFYFIFIFFWGVSSIIDFLNEKHGLGSLLNPSELFPGRGGEGVEGDGMEEKGG